jgi:conjugal transfer ATP-binding protein TraC
MKLPFFPAKSAKPAAQAPTPETPDVDLDRLKKKDPELLFREGMANVLDLIAPASLIVTPNYVQLENRYVRTLFAYTYPRYVQTNWLSTIINYDIQADISMFVYPLESKQVMTNLKRKIGQLESSATIAHEKGMVRDPELETAIGDIEGLRDVLQRGEVKLFQYSLYFTLYAESLEELDTLTKQLESTLGGMLVYTKQAILQMEPGFASSIPLGQDELSVRRNLDTASLSTTFPFTSTELTSNE